jgi:hypothetical protein
VFGIHDDLLLGAEIAALLGEVSKLAVRGDHHLAQSAD